MISLTLNSPNKIEPHEWLFDINSLVSYSTSTAECSKQILVLLWRLRYGYILLS